MDYHVVFEYTTTAPVTEVQIDRAGGRLATYGATIAHGTDRIGVTVTGDYPDAPTALSELYSAVGAAFWSVGAESMDFHHATVYTSLAFDTREVEAD
ncbi:hypothetical protein [Catellatospora sichuanensis]|uniref:hypothetical protein n=1 Tax=Catellatospora sichuanensis TaxID=1969805 RepID=UPI00118371B4|nr:hypothetical protein [Catellatospora sichuanensis]